MDHTVTLTGEYETAALPGGRFRLRALGSPGWVLYLQGVVAADPASALAGAASLAVRWPERAGGAVELRVGLPAAAATDRTAPIRAAGAILHEPLDGLYANLPLARYDAPARRFWARVMTIARLPGGAWLLGRLARRRAGA